MTEVETSTRAISVAEEVLKRKKRRPRKAMLGLLGVITALLIWELVSRVGLIDSRYFPPASGVIVALLGNFALPNFWTALGQTVTAWGIGLAASIALALPIGIVIGLSPFLRRATHSTIEFLRPIPSVALIPLAVLLLGVGIESTLMLVIYASFWQILIQVLYGVADVDNIAMNTARSYSFNRWQRIRDVVFPTMLPFLMTGLRLAAAVALILAVTAELVIGSPGLGSQIALAQSAGVYPPMYALVLATGLLGVLINIGARLLEHHVLSWHHSVREEAH